MVDLIELTNAFVATLQAIPELVLNLDQGLPTAISGYIDIAPTKNSWSAALYQMKPGTVLVVWQETLFAEGEMEAWTHHVQFFVRAQRGGSALTLINNIVNGIPDPGNGLRWRYCPVMTGLLPTAILEITRLSDTEGVDYHVISTETKESGDA